MFKALVLILIAGWAYADTGYNVPAVVVSTDATKAKTYGIQRLILSSGTALSVSGSNATISTNRTTVSSMTISNINTNQIQFQVNGDLIKYKDGTVIFSVPEVQSFFTGYNTNLINAGGVFNTSYGTTAMPYPNTGNFNSCFSNSCMSGNLLSGENNNAQGYGSLGSLSSGFYNNCFGGSSCNSISTAYYNTGVGGYALQLNVSGHGNTGIGLQAGQYVTGAYNTDIGYQSGVSTDTANASGADTFTIFIGPQSGRNMAKATTITNAGAIGYSAYVGKSNAFQMGGNPASGLEWEVMTTSFTTQGGWVRVSPHTKAEFGADTPLYVYEVYGCSDCATVPACISTGTARGAYALLTNRGSACQ